LVFLYKFTWNYPKRSVGDDFNWAIVIIGDRHLTTKLPYPVGGINGPIKLHYVLQYTRSMVPSGCVDTSL
jgi:hypothetical protein